MLLEIVDHADVSEAERAATFEHKGDAGTALAAAGSVPNLEGTSRVYGNG
jgi:hypothetical protein